MEAAREALRQPWTMGADSRPRPLLSQLMTSPPWAGLPLPAAVAGAATLQAGVPLAALSTPAGLGPPHTCPLRLPRGHRGLQEWQRASAAAAVAAAAALLQRPSGSRRRVCSVMPPGLRWRQSMHSFGQMPGTTPGYEMQTLSRCALQLVLLLPLLWSAVAGACCKLPLLALALAPAPTDPNCCSPAPPHMHARLC
jgi:hypothetical protein